MLRSTRAIIAQLIMWHARLATEIYLQPFADCDRKNISI